MLADKFECKSSPSAMGKRASQKALSNRCLTLILLCLLVLLGGAMRFYRISEPGFTEGDDYMYAETANTLLLLTQWSHQNSEWFLADGNAVNSLKGFFAQHSVIPQTPFSCKPFYDFTNALAIGLVSYNEWVLPAKSALLGTLSIIAIFLLGKELFGVRSGLWAAALLTVSGGGLVYSRYGLAHMASVFFFLVGFWLYVRSIAPPFSLKLIGSCSFFFGLAITTHTNLLPYVGLFPLYELAIALKNDITWRRMVSRAIVGLGIMVALGVLLNIPFQLMRLFWGPFFDKIAAELTWPFMTYFEQLPRYFGVVITDTAPGFKERFYTYVVEFWAWEGNLVVAILLGSLLWRIREFRRLHIHDVVTYTQLVGPLLFWIFSENEAVLRFAAGTLPVAMVIVGKELDRITLFLKSRWGWNAQIAVAALALLVVGYNAQNSLVIYQARSADKEVAEWLHSEDQSSILVNRPVSFRFYGILPMPLSVEGLAHARYVAFYRRYVTEKERRILAVIGDQEPALIAIDRRPGKLLEVQFVKSNMVLKLLHDLPVVGAFVDDMRFVVLERNNMRRLEVYDTVPRKAEIAGVL